LDHMDAKTDWKTPMARGRPLGSLLEEGSTLEPEHVVPPFHKWLSEVCGESDGGAFVNKLLCFPADELEPKLVTANLPALSRHFWAAIFLTRLLGEDPTRDPDALRSAVAVALKSHDARSTRKARLLKDEAASSSRSTESASALKDAVRNGKRPSVPKRVTLSEEGFRRQPVAVAPRSDELVLGDARTDMPRNVVADQQFGGAKPSLKRERYVLNAAPDRDGFSKRSSQQPRQAEFFLPPTSRSYLQRQAAALGTHASEPVMLPAVVKPNQSVIQRGRHGEAMLRCKSEVAAGIPHPGCMIMLPKIPRPRRVLAAPVASHVSKSNVFKKAFQEIVYEAPSRHDPSTWRP